MNDIREAYAMCFLKNAGDLVKRFLTTFFKLLFSGIYILLILWIFNYSTPTIDIFRNNMFNYMNFIVPITLGQMVLNIFRECFRGYGLPYRIYKEEDEYYVVKRLIYEILTKQDSIEKIYYKEPFFKLSGCSYAFDSKNREIIIKNNKEEIVGTLEEDEITGISIKYSGIAVECESLNDEAN